MNGNVSPHRMLLLPLAIEDETVRRRQDWLSRQLPVLVRNAIEPARPGAVVASPLATEEDGKRVWMIHRGLWDREQARVFGRDRGYERIGFGSLVEGADIAGERVIRWLVLDTATGAVLMDEFFQGVILAMAGQIVERFARVVGIPKEEARSLFQAGTTSAEAFEHYLHGLDVLLTQRSDGIELVDPAGALEPFDEALRLDPRFENALTGGLSCALLAAKDSSRPLPLEPVLATLEVWRDRRPEDVRIFAVGGELLASHGRNEDALRWLRDGLRATQPVHRDLLRRSADILVDLGRQEEALEAYARCEAMRHENPVLERMAHLAIVLNRYGEAATHLRRLLEYQPQRKDLQVRLALVSERMEDLDGMWDLLAGLFDDVAPPDNAQLSKLNAILARHEPPARFVDRLSGWYPPADLAPEARLLFVRSLRLAGAKATARLCLDGMRMARLSSEQKSAAARERLNLLHENFDAVFGELARAIVNEGMLPEDTSLLDEATAEAPDFWPAHFLRGLVLAKTGAFEESLESLDRVLAIQPENDVVWYTRGLQLENLGRNEEARSSFESAISFNAAEPDYHTHLALTQARLKDMAGARASLEKVLALRPEHPDNERIRQAIEGIQ